MNFWKLKSWIAVCILLACCPLHAIHYRVRITGPINSKIIDELANLSDLVLLQTRPPRSINALRYRAQDDVPDMIKLLHAYGYYDAQIFIDLEEQPLNIIDVNLFIDPGPRYLLHSYLIYASCKDKVPLPIENKFDFASLHLELKKPAVSQQILDSRVYLLNELAIYGYPLAKIDKQDVFVDKEKKIVDVVTCVDTGPLCNFGKLTVEGLKTVNPRFLFRRIPFKQGQTYSEEEINETRKRLNNTNLFSSVRITHADTVDEDNELPITINLIEAKHKNFNIAASYATVDRFGGSVVFTNRNFRQMGEILSFKAYISQKSKEGIITYIKPDFRRTDQDYVLQLQALRENISPYLAYTYSGLSRIDRRINRQLEVSWGLYGAYIDVTQSANNGKFALLGLPIFLKYSTANYLLDPTKGFIFTYRITPYQNVIKDQDFFLKQTATLSWYVPIMTKEILVLAWRVLLGSIAGAPYTSVPLTILYLGGSDDDLRGYKYRTVSPRNQDGDPLGGRSAIYWTFEPRFRLTESIGLVVFTDWGNVRETVYPTVEGKWHKSVGFGLRYFTFFGPLRLDVGFPLNRRSNKDKRYRIYVSIGQTF